jgi:hypothetical protein
MTNLTSCGRSERFAGQERDFDLGQRYVLCVLSGDPGSAQTEWMMRYGMEAPLTGQYGDTPAACLKRFENGVYSIRDVEILLSLGLWGGGMPLSDAIRLSNENVRGKPLGDHAALAFRVLGSLFVGGANVRAPA